MAASNAAGTAALPYLQHHKPRMRAWWQFVVVALASSQCSSTGFQPVANRRWKRLQRHRLEGDATYCGVIGRDARATVVAAGVRVRGTLPAAHSAPTATPVDPRNP